MNKEKMNKNDEKKGTRKIPEEFEEQRKRITTEQNQKNGSNKDEKRTETII